MKPVFCPFCGGANVEIGEEVGGFPQVMCYAAGCGASGPAREDDEAAAVEAWNAHLGGVVRAVLAEQWAFACAVMLVGTHGRHGDLEPRFWDSRAWHMISNYADPLGDHLMEDGRIDRVIALVEAGYLLPCAEDVVSRLHPR